MKILIIGGSKFLGRHLSDTAMARGDELTIFNRGKISTHVDPAAEYIQGDRHKDLDKLAGRGWDVVIDTCGYLPQSVAISAAVLKESVGRYVFVSSISAYAGFDQPNMDETSPLAVLNDEKRERFKSFDLSQDITAAVLGESYGPLKAACEQKARDIFGKRTLIIRPGLIVGPFDPTDRFTYWVMKIAKGGDVLAPGRPERFIQVIDARDLSEWILTAIKKECEGDFNATGRQRDLTMGGFLETARETLNPDARTTWVDWDLLEREGAESWSELPLYLPEPDESSKGFLDANVDKALDTGLHFRPLADTIRDTFEWRKTQTFDMRAGLSPDREAELLLKWSEQQG